MSDNIERKWQFCEKCSRPREAELDRKTGKALITLPLSCFDREVCEQEILPGFKPNQAISSRQSESIG